MLTDNPNAPLILIVEDEESHAELMKLSIQDAPEEYRLEMAGNLRSALLVMERQTPDLVLADYRLPDGNGSELVPHVKGLCPVVMLTSQGNEQLAVDAMKIGALDYVVKSSAVFAGMTRIVQRGLREWSLIKEQKRAEEERWRMERHLLHIQKLESLGTMSGGIAHDFNNLLQAVLGNLELGLLKLPVDSPAKKFIFQAVSAAERAANLSGMMLTYTGKGVYNIKPQNLTEVVNNIAPMLALTVSKSITLDMRPGIDLPLIMADADLIQQVTMNLVINASEAIGNANGAITLSAGYNFFDQKVLNSSRLEEKLAAGSYVWMKITDSGCGMDTDTCDKLFDPFFTTKFTGRGLGMSAVMGIIRAHKGAILVESRQGAGTTIQVLFPVASDMRSTTACSAVSDREPMSAAMFPAGRILVVDDEQMVREVSRNMVEELGFETIVVDGGEEALRIFQEQGDRINLVLLDHSMPGMDGVAVFRELRRIRPDIRVLLASGYNEKEVTERFSGLGLDGFIQKPFLLSNLKNELQRLLKR